MLRMVSRLPSSLLNLSRCSTMTSLSATALTLAARTLRPISANSPKQPPAVMRFTSAPLSSYTVKAPFSTTKKSSPGCPFLNTGSPAL